MNPRAFRAWLRNIIITYAGHFKKCIAFRINGAMQRGAARRCPIGRDATGTKQARWGLVIQNYTAHTVVIGSSPIGPFGRAAPMPHGRRVLVHLVLGEAAPPHPGSSPTPFSFAESILFSGRSPPRSRRIQSSPFHSRDRIAQSEIIIDSIASETHTHI